MKVNLSTSSPIRKTSGHFKKQNSYQTLNSVGYDSFDKSKQISFKGEDKKFGDIKLSDSFDSEYDFVFLVKEYAESLKQDYSAYTGTETIRLTPSNETLYKQMIYLISAGHANLVMQYFKEVKEASKYRDFSPHECDAISYALKMPKLFTTKEELIENIIKVKSELNNFYSDGSPHGQEPSKEQIESDVQQAWYKAEDNFKKYFSTLSSLDEFIQCRVNYPHFSYLIDPTLKPYADSMLSQGRIEEFKKKFKEDWCLVHEMLEEYGVGQNENHDVDINYDFSQTPTTDFDSENRLINEKLKAKQDGSLQEAQEIIARAKGNGLWREIKNIATLGCSEKIRQEAVISAQNEILQKANQDALAERTKLDARIKAENKDKKDQIDKIKKAVDIARELDVKLAGAKDVLSRELISKINDDYNGVPIDDMPNCVMFIGDNPFIAQELSTWTSNALNTEFVMIPSDMDNDKMQDDIDEELEAAEEMYQKTGKRTLLFVEGMDKLLRHDFNSNSNIAAMKNIMQRCAEDYHTTIMFYGPDPENYEAAINSEGRIDVRVNIPITKQEACEYQKMLKGLN